MLSYESEKAELSRLCGLCGGFCCISWNIPLSGREFSRLMRLGDFPHGKTTTQNNQTIRYIDVLKHNRCPFFKEDNETSGRRYCILEGRLRSLICRIYPLTYTYELGRISFHLSNKCPYIDQISRLRMWIEKTIEEALKELDAEWSSEEKKSAAYYLTKQEKGLRPL